MTDKFTSALLAALNASAEVKESDWNSIEAVLRRPIDEGEPVVEIEAVEAVGAADSMDVVEQPDPLDAGPRAAGPQVSENRFAATISSGMAKIRSGQ
jgi:hypothetical protein